MRPRRRARGYCEVSVRPVALAGRVACGVTVVAENEKENHLFLYFTVCTSTFCLACAPQLLRSTELASPYTHRHTFVANGDAAQQASSRPGGNQRSSSWLSSSTLRSPTPFPPQSFARRLMLVAASAGCLHSRSSGCRGQLSLPSSVSSSCRMTHVRMWSARSTSSPLRASGPNSRRSSSHETTSVPTGGAPASAHAPQVRSGAAPRRGVRRVLGGRRGAGAHSPPRRRPRC